MGLTAVHNKIQPFNCLIDFSVLLLNAKTTQNQTNQTKKPTSLWAKSITLDYYLDRKRI